jgi:PTS system mannose-specific IIB component/fructoselysine and glucoselysine-specific PTS system IIB component
MRRLVDLSNGIRAINLGGIHHRAGRLERVRYIYLTPEEEQVLRSLEARGIAITAQDVPSARPLPLNDLLVGHTAHKP